MAEDGGEEWVFTEEQLKHHTASREDGLSESEEETYRIKTCDLLRSLGLEKLKMSRQVVWVAALITHRFFTVESFRKRDRLLVAACSLWIAGKLEDKQRSLTELVGHYLAMRYHIAELPKPDSDLMKRTKLTFVDFERLIMHAIGFHLYVDVPAGKVFTELAELVRGFAPQEPGITFFSNASNFLNDCFFKTSLCIRCPVSFLPSIAMFMCLLYYNVPEPDGRREVLLSSQPNKPRRCSSWREGLGIEQTVQHYVLLKRLADLYRSQRGDKYRQMLERFDAEYKAVEGDSKPT